MFGGGLNVPVPDIDRTDHLLMLGANPFASNGSLATAPDWPGRLERLVERGGKVVVVDPRRSRTAEMATEWVPDPARRRRLPADGDGAGDHQRGPRRPRRAAPSSSPASTSVVEAAAPFTPEVVADGHRPRRRPDPPAGPRARRRAHRVRLRPHRHHHRRVRHAHVVARRRAQRAHRQPRPARRRHVHQGGGRRQQHPRQAPLRPRGAPPPPHEPCARAAGDLRRAAGGRAWPRRWTRPGEGQIRALVTIAGNPVLSTPNSARLDAALANLECMVSVDIYVNETTRHADVILPAPTALQKGHYDLALLQLALHDTANYSEPVLPLDDDQPDRVGGAGPPRPGAPGRRRDGRSGAGRRPDDHLAGAGGGGRRDEPDPRARRRRDPRAPRASHRPRAHPRPPAAHRPLRRGLRRRPRRPVARQAARQPARRRPRCPQAPPPRRAPHARRHDRPRARAAPRRRASALGRPRRAARPPVRAGRPPRPAVEQLVDAQRVGAREGQAAVHRAPPPRRRRRARRWPTATTPSSAHGWGRCACRSRSPTPSGPGW